MIRFLSLGLITVTANAVAAPAFHVETLAKGVYAVIRDEPVGLSVDCNVVLIVNEKDVVMVDANIGPTSARETLRALRKITDKPVRYVISTHYHDDHIGGNATVQRAFPNAEFIAHESFSEAMRTLGIASRKNMIETAPQMTAMLRDLIKRGKGMDGLPLDAEEKASYSSDIRLADRYAREMPSVKLVTPTIVVDDRLTLKRGDRTIEIRHLGHGHTPSDLVVWLPSEKIAVVGDLVVWPVPLVGDPQSDVTTWPTTLRNLVALKPATIVPGHGKVLRDASYPETLIRFFEAVSTGVKDSLAKGETLDQAQKRIRLPEFAKEMAGESRVRKFLFAVYARGPAVANAYRLLTKRQ